MKVILSFFKIITIMLFACANIILFACANTMQTQTEIKTINGHSYVFDYQNLKVYRQATQKLKYLKTNMAQNFFAKPKTPICNVYRKVFSTERLEELKSEKMVTKFTCDSNGKVENVEFLFFKTPFLSVDEIDKLEEAFRNYTFDLQIFGERTGHYTFALACFFKKL